jgi:hypothetical protein
LKTLVQMAAVFALGAVVGSMTIPALSAQLRTQTDKRLIAVDLAGFCDGKVVAVDYSEESPGLIANHYHPGHLFNYILEGSRTVAVAGVPPQTIRAGEIHHEAPMQANISNNLSAARVLTFRILEKGKPESVPVP